MRPDAHPSPGNRVSLISSKRKVVRVCQIDAAQVSVAVHSHVANLYGVRAHITNQRRSNQEPILIKLNTSSIVVVEQASLDCVAFADEVLTKQVGDVDVLMAGVNVLSPLLYPSRALRSSRVELVALLSNEPNDGAPRFCPKK